MVANPVNKDIKSTLDRNKRIRGPETLVTTTATKRATPNKTPKDSIHPLPRSFRAILHPRPACNGVNADGIRVAAGVTCSD